MHYFFFIIYFVTTTYTWKLSYKSGPGPSKLSNSCAGLRESLCVLPMTSINPALFLKGGGPARSEGMGTGDGVVLLLCCFLCESMDGSMDGRLGSGVWGIWGEGNITGLVLTAYNIHGLIQERHNSSALAMELCLSWINPLICPKLGDVIPVGHYWEYSILLDPVSILRQSFQVWQFPL